MKKLLSPLSVSSQTTISQSSLPPLSVSPQTTLLLFLLIIYSFFTTAQIKNGPMVGYSEMKEVMLWVQTEKVAKVKFNYWEQDKPSVKMTTDEVLTTKKDGFKIGRASCRERV